MAIATKSTTQTVVELLSHLVRMPTITSDQATNRAALDWVEGQLHSLPLRISRLEHNGFPALIATTPAVKDPKNPKLWLVAHMDVVAGSLASFKPQIKNDRLYGRGTHDMKFGLAVFIVLLQELDATLENYDLGLMVTTDEEVGGFDGVKWLLEDLGYRGHAALIPDCNGSWKMEMGAKGVMWWKLTATGSTSHAGRTWEGQNAIDSIMQFISQLRTHFIAEPCGDANHRHATLNFASIIGGASTNQVPDSATARIDIRFPPSLSTGDITSWIKKAESVIPRVKAKILLSDESYRVKPNHVGPLFETITQDITGHGITHITAHGSSDARHFAHYDIPTINATSTGSGYHVPDEWIDITDLGRFYEITRRFVGEYTKG